MTLKDSYFNYLDSFEVIFQYLLPKKFHIKNIEANSFFFFIIIIKNN